MCRLTTLVYTGICFYCLRRQRYMTRTVAQCFNNNTGKYEDVSAWQICGKGFPRVQNKKVDPNDRYRSRKALQVIVDALDGPCDECLGRVTAAFRDEVDDEDEWE